MSLLIYCQIDLRPMISFPISSSKYLFRVFPHLLTINCKHRRHCHYVLYCVVESDHVIILDVPHTPAGCLHALLTGLSDQHLYHQLVPREPQGLDALLDVIHHEPRDLCGLIGVVTRLTREEELHAVQHRLFGTSHGETLLGFRAVRVLQARWLWGRCGEAAVSA